MEPLVRSNVVQRKLEIHFNHNFQLTHQLSLHTQPLRMHQSLHWAWAATMVLSATQEPMAAMDMAAMAHTVDTVDTED